MSESHSLKVWWRILKKFKLDNFWRNLKNNILTKVLDESILRKFSSTPSKNDVIGGLTKQQ